MDSRIFEVQNFFKKGVLTSFAAFLHTATAILTSLEFVCCLFVFLDTYPLCYACKQLKHSGYMKTTNGEELSLGKNEIVIPTNLRSNPMKNRVSPSYLGHSWL